eukprot:3100510-Prymnesium_polylepis.1
MKLTLPTVDVSQQGALPPLRSLVSARAPVPTLAVTRAQVFAQLYDWKDVAKEEEDPDLMKRYRSFNQANVPPLRAWTRGATMYGKAFDHFATLASRAFDAPAPTVDNCTGAWAAMLEERLASLGGKTDPAMIRLVLDLFELTNISEVRALPQIDALLTAPQDYRPMLHQASACAETNAPLRAYACAALANPSSLMTRLQGDPAFIEEELTQALHFGVALEVVTAAAVADPDVRTAVHWQITLIASRIYERITLHVQVTPTQRQYYKELEKSFKRQKFHSVETALREHQLVGVNGRTRLIQIAPTGRAPGRQCVRKGASTRPLAPFLSRP